jgi:hypothetical protein
VVIGADKEKIIFQEPKEIFKIAIKEEKLLTK